MNSTLLFLTTILSSLLLISCSSESQNANYPINKVTDGIYYHQGVHQDASEQNIGAIANVGFIIGEQCIAVIDTGGSFIEGNYLYQAIRQQSDLPICYVINTHVHPDHIFGNAAFKVEKPTFIGHEKLPAALASRQPFFARTFKETLGKAYNGVEFIAPTKTVAINDPLTLDLGKREITLTSYSTSHTDHDLTVFDHATKTLWTGDLLFMERIPVLDGSINGWLTIMEQLQSMNINYVVPGHGPASSDQWQQGFANQIRYFSTIREGVREIIADFGTIEQASKQVGISEENSWELFPQYHRRNITASFVELEWE